jgi:ABC-type oligopeptide transport system ATPase subunit
LIKDLIKIERLSKSYPSKSGLFLNDTKSIILNDISFTIPENSSFGLLGKTGSGKTTIGLCALRLIEPDSGNIFYRETNLIGLKYRELQGLRKNLQIIFQDPDTSLNPVYSIKEMLCEVLTYHKISEKTEIDEKIDDLLEQVGIQRKEKGKYPHEFSTGQKQRICIARALAAMPEFIVLDEITSSLDIFNRNKIIDLLLSLREKYGLGYLFISHNPELAKEFCDELAFLKDGNIILQGKSDDVVSEIKHLYF